MMRPRPTISAGSSALITPPSNVTVPAVGLTSPEMVRNSVVLPAPLAPIMVTTSLAPTSIETPCRIIVRPYPATTSETLSIDEFLSKIGFDDATVANHRGRVALGNHLAGIDHHDAIRQIHDGLHVVLDGDDRNAGVAYRADDLDHLVGVGLT